MALGGVLVTARTYVRLQHRTTCAKALRWWFYPPPPPPAPAHVRAACCAPTLSPSWQPWMPTSMLRWIPSMNHAFGSASGKMDCGRLQRQPASGNAMWHAVPSVLFFACILPARMTICLSPVWWAGTIRRETQLMLQTHPLQIFTSRQEAAHWNRAAGSYNKLALN